MNSDPLPKESCLLGQKKKDPRATAVADDPSTALQHNSSLIAKILSYMIESTQDIASLRLVSKTWNSSILPYVLRSGVVFDAYKHRGGKAFIEALASEYVYDDDGARFDSEIEDHDALKTNTSDFLKKFEERNAREGVVFVDGMIPSDLHDSLMQAIDDFAQKQDVDYHPHSNEILRDIVHPALYPYVKGISPTTKSVQDVAPVTSVIDDDGDDDAGDGTDEKDYWGRPYESSKYQWLPTYFDIEDDGTCKICDYINNLLPRAENEILYSLLACLFSYAVPLFESVLTYGRTMRPYLRDDIYKSNDGLAKHMSLRGERLQVVTKIVDYELAPGETYEGVWHVEGMSHEEIVATALYYIDKDEDIEGGDIIFKRAFSNQEAGYDGDPENSILEQYNGQDTRAYQMDEILDGGFIPLGRVETLSKRLLVFPNSHVHKVTKIKNVDNKSKRRKVDNSSEVTDRKKMKQKRRIVVFFLVNPSKRIVSTREVPIQQEPIGSMSKSDAMMHRLKLMKERKYAKEHWNLREIHLCEH